jgi:hypothetical protein
MIRKLTSLLRMTAQNLDELSGTTPPKDASEEPEDEQQAAADRSESVSTQHESTPSAPAWQRFIDAERVRIRWLRSHLYVVAITLGLAIFFVIAEQWLIETWGWLTSQVQLYWPILTSHPLAMVAVGLALFYLIFGFQWLRYVDDFLRWFFRSVKKRARLSILVGTILLILLLWIANNYGTWIVLPFVVGQTETVQLNGETVAAQLIAELNQVGVGNPTPVLILWELQEPRTSSGRVTARRNLPFEECDTVLQGPGSFTRRSQPVPLTRVLAGSQGSRLDLGNLSIGGISIPSQILTQFLANILPTGYREFSGQINENNGELEISVTSKNPSMAWRIAGPSVILPEMIEYLALRIALDLNPNLIKSSGLDAAPSDRDLAFALGNQAFRQQRYQRAQAFYQLADHFAPLDEKVDVMLGLSYYHLAVEHIDHDTAQLEVALWAMEAAVREDPKGDSSLLRPYLACLYHKAGYQEQAEAERVIFGRYLRRLESQDFEVRTDSLKQLPLRGPGRHLSATGDDVIFVDALGNIIGAAGQPLDANLLLSNQNPRQIGLYGSSKLLYVSSDGTVYTYSYQQTEETQTPTILIEGRALSGVQQLATSASQFRRTNLFLLNREGEVYWCELDAESNSTNACLPQQVIEAPDARQVFPVEDQLYMLAADGAVWSSKVDLDGQSSKPQSITPAAPVHEIFVADDGTLYLLHENGNVWRYYDDGRAETEDLKLIDPGTGTAQIFAAGDFLYLLKSDGAVWRISNPRNPAPTSDFVEISIPPQGMTAQELFITNHEVASDSRSLYLLTDQRALLKGTDVGDARVTFGLVTIDITAQTTVSQ